MSQVYVPKPYAADAMAHLLKPRCALFAGMGSGKTVLVLTHLAVEYRYMGRTAPTLVLATQRVASTTWPEEVKKWKHLEGLKAVSVTGNEAKRTAALKHGLAIGAHVFVTNYENLQWLRQKFPKRQWPFGKVVADESTKLKSFRLRQGGIRAQALAEVAHSPVEEWVNLTGTPASNGLADLWGQMWFIDKGARLGRTFSDFQNRWFKPPRGDFGAWLPMPHAQEEIQTAIKDVCLTIDPRDYFDIAQPIVQVVMVDLEEEQQKKYRQLEREMFLQLAEEKNTTAVNAAALSVKCLQFANGAVYIDRMGGPATEFIEVHDGKIEALRRLVEELDGAPLLVAYHFKADLARLLASFPEGRHLDADPNTVEQWNRGGIRLLFAHPASAGHGLNLQYGGNRIAFFGNWWDLELHDQIIERIGPVRQMQAGLNRPVFIYYLVCRGTVDELVIARRSSKRSVQDLLLSHMKGGTR